MDDAEDQAVPLREALIRWCDPALVERIRLIENVVTVDESRELRLLRLGPRDGDPRRLRISLYSGILNRKAELSAAWADLLNDFRRRVERGQIHLAGVMTWPSRETERRPIPNLWAADFAFDFAAGRISVRQFQYASYSYVAVVASLEAFAERPKADTDPTIPAPLAVPADDVDVQPLEVTRRPTIDAPGPAAVEAGNAGSVVQSEDGKGRERGRKSLEGIIEAAMRLHWDNMQLSQCSADGAWPEWASLARHLHKRMLAEAKKAGGAKVPAEETVRKHVRNIYTRLAGEKDAQPESAQ